MSRTGFRFNIRSPWFYLPLLFVLVAGLGTYWFLHNFEKKEFTYHRGISPAAKRNPLLAAEMFLNMRGIPATGQAGMDVLRTLPSPKDTILVRRMPAMLSQKTSDNLFAWVKQGGHLLMVPSGYESDHPDAVNLLEQLNVVLVYEEDDSDQEEKDTVGEKDTDDDSKQESHRYESHDKVIECIIDKVPLRIKVHGYGLLEAMDNTADYRISGSHRLLYTGDETKKQENPPIYVERDGSWLLQYAIGQGKITLLSEITPFTNRNVDKYDHASMLEWLIQDAENVWIIYAGQARSLPEIIRTAVPRFCFAAFILLLLVLWRVQKRGGLIRHPRYRNQPNITAHIMAVGNYNWRHDRMATTVKENRTVLLARLTGRYLGPLARQNAEKPDMGALALKSGISQETLSDAFGREADNEHELILISRAMQNIEAKLQVKEKANERSNG